MTIEHIMFLGIGFLAACLLTLGFIPLVHARAVRLTTRRHQNAMPASVSEMQAEKDGLRAEFAMSTRRFEMALEDARAKAAGHLCEVGKKTQEIQLLKTEFGKAAADHLSEMARKSEETQSLLTELEQLSANFGHEPPRQSEENRGNAMIGGPASDLSDLGTKTQKIELPKTECGKASADHPSEIAQKSEEIQNLRTEIDRVTAHYGHEIARPPEDNRDKTKIDKEAEPVLSVKVPKPKGSAVLKLQKLSVIKLQKPPVKWLVSAAASFFIVSLLVLAAGSDREDERGRTAFILRGGSAARPPAEVTKPALREAREAEAAVIWRGIGQANPAIREGEAVPRSADIVIIRGGRRESKPQ